MPAFVTIKRKRFAPGSAAASVTVVIALGLALTSPLSAQALRTDGPTSPAAILVEGEAAKVETVVMLTGLAAIERDMMLGILFLNDGLVSTVGSHFTHARQESLPLIKDGLAAAGIADFEPLLVALEGATDDDAVKAAEQAVMTAVLKAGSALKPSDQDRIMAMVAGLKAAHDRFNAAGPTDAVDYQNGWAGLIVERGKVDLLMKSADPAIAKAATDLAVALDDIILSLPDPATAAPVTFDPAPIAELLGQISALDASI